ncbi:uncharacterized protein B0H18DRAFT_591081 [Fomitopsis serialis]|uniref:uncharacterized protein n=1 Tax=Fomitopsis serialis TaxID=139415 RepID=UPI002008ADE3|nr:uncharacterized protein B0H18DRAFT_591081 [Neoantrodia serialis]KAH9907652.1 hypothetical protein B0H18DRAFT_591081 [Neoantrodia serialis]
MRSIAQKSVNGAVRRALVPGYWTLASAFSMDFYITCVLCYILFNRRTAFRRTNTILERLIIYTINRGVLLCLLSLLCIALYPVDGKRGSLYSETVSAPEAALYVNSLMAVYVLYFSRPW